MPTSLQLGQLMAVIYTRDVWLHRVDITRATGRDLHLDEIDRRTVEDVVGEWAVRLAGPSPLSSRGRPAASSARVRAVRR